MSDKILCPKCGSDQITAQKKGFSPVKAVAGGLLLGGVGLLAGAHGSGKIDVTCMACGKTWNPKALAESKQRANIQISSNNQDKWRAKYYQVYESGDMIEASRMLRAKYGTGSVEGKIQDPHIVYKHFKSVARENAIVMITMMSIIVAIAVGFMWLIS